MPRGGARNRSGPAPDPKSGRSDRRGYTLTALPSEGYTHTAPDFPLPAILRWNEFYEAKAKKRELDQGATEQFRDRELAIWRDAWSSPQACVWSSSPWRWQTIGEYCRLKAIVELEPDANAALVAQLHRYRDQIGLTPAGLKENGWAIAVDEVAAKSVEDKGKASAPAPQPRRLRAVGDASS